MRKKVVCILLVIIMMLLWIPSGLADGKAKVNLDIQPMWTYINSVDNGLSINGSGAADMWSEANASSSITKIVMNNYLQRNVSGTWTTVTSWGQTTYDNYATWDHTYYVTSGYYYRLRTYFYFYIGSTVAESTYLTSPSDYY
jgi:hypothetical protein